MREEHGAPLPYIVRFQNFTQASFTPLRFCFPPKTRLQDLETPALYAQALKRVFPMWDYWASHLICFAMGSRRKELSVILCFMLGIFVHVFLSARPFSSGDNIVRERFYKANGSKSAEWQQRKDVVVGFCVVLSHLLNRHSKSAGFSLIRLTLPGRLEIQRYDSSWNLSGEKPETLEFKDSIVYWMSEDDAVFNRYNFFKIFYLYDYIKSNLFNALVMQNSLSNHKETNKVSLSHDIEELISNSLKFSNVSISDFVSDASIPTSIFEIASRRVLSCVRADLLPLVFKKYSDLFGNQRDSSFEFLEVPSCLPHNRLLPFFVGKPSIRSEKWSSKASPGEVLVGPVLPLSVLLALQQIDRPDAIDEQDDDPLTLQCRSILEHVCPEMFVVDIGNTFSNYLGSALWIVIRQVFHQFFDKGIFVDEVDIGTFTIRAVDDPRTLNKILYLRPPANTLSHNEIVSLWEKKVGKTFERVYVPEEVVLKQIQESPVPLNVLLSICHCVFIKGDLTNFQIEPSFGVEATELYPDVKYTTVDEYLNRFL
ncbi:uncharacterized protein LOC103716030 [Phoenix dactylifera]|uniref:Uncharacterized protein LOC103716030 n=1 Tax=Phoenix dactylifera TaxID=42345 RepID=A0A8B8ZLX6_PHODC|nr:uncharacterized protein LOC103716030 [Phoenix dactylifera]